MSRNDADGSTRLSCASPSLPNPGTASSAVVRGIPNYAFDQLSAARRGVENRVSCNINRVRAAPRNSGADPKL
jgi:hypothetical protein